MSKIIVPLHFQEQFSPPVSAGPGVKKFYLRNQWFKIYDGTSESDLVLDRPLDNFTSTSGTITSADSVLSAIEKLDYAVQNISPATIWGSITGTVTNQTDLINYLGSNYYPLSSNPANYITSAALSNYLTISSAASTYYPLTNPAGYISQDQVVEYPNLASFPPTGIVGVVYIALDTDLAYVWDTFSSSYVLTSMPNTGITGIGKTNRIAKFSSPTNVVWSKISEDPVSGSIKVVDSNRAFLDGNSVLSVQRTQSQVDIVLGNPGYSQPSAIWSDNQLDGFEVKSKGILSLKAGTSYLEGLKVLTTGKLQITQTPDTGTTSDYLLLRDSSGNVKQIVYPTIPSLTGYVPYTGATTNVDLGEYELKAGQMTLDTSPTGTAAVGTTQWNNTIGSSETTLKGGTVILKNGVDLVARVVNKVTPNATLLRSEYRAVRVSGAQGQRLAVAYAQANNDTNSADTIGLVCEDIATNQEGFILTVGQFLSINTTGSLQGETWADGDVIYLSPTTAGHLTNVKPNGSNGHIIVIGYVEYAHAIHGSLYVKIMNGWELDELHNVYIDTPLNNQVLAYNSTSQLWENESVKTLDGLSLMANADLSYFNQLAFEQNFGYITPNVGNTTYTGIRTTNSNSQTGQTAEFGYPARMLYASATTLGAFATQRGTVGGNFIPNINLKMYWKRRFQIDCNISGSRFVCALSNMFSLAAPTNVEPDTLINTIGVCKLSTSSNLHFFWNDATGTATTVDLGVNYPANNVTAYYYDLEIYKEFSTNNITMKITRIDASGNRISTTQLITSNVNNGVTHSPVIYGTNNATASSFRFYDYGIIFKHYNLGWDTI